MPLMSGGQLVLSDTIPQVANGTWHPSTGLNLTTFFSSYGAIYKKQLWVEVVVRKRALATRRLPLKVYRRVIDGREEQRDHRLTELLRKPNSRHHGAFLWEWTSSTFDIYGEAIWLKVRGPSGMPAQLWPIHPSNIVIRQRDDGGIEYVYGIGVAFGSDPQYVIPERDVVHFKTYNPDSTLRGMSTLEPLRQTLVNEDAARRASSAFWSNGARPSGYLAHPGNLSQQAADRLKAQWEAIHGGVDNFGKWAVLEEGMEPKVLSLSAEESQYIESRRLNREEVCGAYDIPPPVVHILDRATFSNITEQMRSMYRDTMAPHLSGFEATLEFQLVPDFGDEALYTEFQMNEVLRGDFEQRVTAYQTGINGGWLLRSEVREMENLPAIDGLDVAIINSTMVPADQANAQPTPRELAEMIQKIYLGVGKVLTADEAREILDRAGAGLGTAPPALPQVPENPAPSAKALDALWGRLGSYETLEDIEPGVLTAGLNGHADVVLALLEESRANGESVAEFRARVRHCLKETL